MSSQNTPNETVAWFETLDEVRAAQVHLERRGIDAVHIRVANHPTVADRRRVDRRFGSWLGKRALIGALIGVVVGALIGVGAGLLLGATGAELTPYAMAGAIFGVAPGFFYTVGTRLPAAPEAFDTFGDEPEGDTWLAVSGSSDLQRQAVEALNELEPTRLVTA